MSTITKFIIADHRAVEIARHFYEKTKIPFVVSVGNHSNWDCQSTDGLIRIEIKCETTPSRTGRICLEYWNSHLNIPSGILSTEANIWVHCIPEGDSFLAIEYEISRLRKLVIENGEFSSNGHDALFKLIKIEEFKKNANRTFNFVSKY